MAKIRTVTLPPEFSEHLAQLLESCPDQLLIHVGQRYLPGGFTQPAAIRERLAGKVRGAGVLEGWLVALLRQGIAGGPTIKALSLEGLQQAFDSLAVLMDRGTVVLGALLDPREEIHRFGAEMLGKGTAAPPDADRKAAKLALCQMVDRLFLSAAEMRCTPETPSPKESKTDPNADPSSKSAGEKAEEEEVDVNELIELMEKMRHVVESKEKAIEHLKKGIEDQRRKHQTRLDHAARHAASEKQRIVTQREEARRQVLRLTKENTALTGRMDELLAQQQVAVSQGVHEQTSDVMRKWLEAPMQTQEQLEQLNARSPDLLSRVEHALEAQARQDRFTGNRLELERKLGQLREARERLSRAAASALCPATELRLVLTEVEEEMARVEKTLTGQRPVDPIVDRLLVAINQTRSWNQTRECSLLLEQLAELELVPREDHRRLYDALQRKFSLHEERQKDRAEHAPDNGWSLRDTIYRNRSSLLLLDGHNILFGLEDIFRRFYEEDGHPGRRARDHFVQILRQLVETRPNVHARLCFDAPHRQVVKVATNLEIEFSGGQGDHRADRRIRNHLFERRPESGDQKWYVVSDDRGVRRQAAKNNAIPVPIDLFAVLLADFRCLAEEHAAAQAA
jgi:hypothetical protein